MSTTVVGSLVTTKAVPSWRVPLSRPPLLLTPPLLRHRAMALPMKSHKDAVQAAAKHLGCVSSCRHTPHRPLLHRASAARARQPPRTEMARSSPHNAAAAAAAAQLARHRSEEPSRQSWTLRRALPLPPNTALPRPPNTARPLPPRPRAAPPARPPLGPRWPVGALPHRIEPAGRRWPDGSHRVEATACADPRLNDEPERSEASGPTDLWKPQ